MTQIAAFIFSVFFGLNLFSNSCFTEFKSNKEKLLTCLEFQITNHKLPWSNPEDIVPLSQCDFDESFKKGILSDDERTRLLKVSYSVSNPVLFEPSLEEVSSEEYSLNFLWINKQKLPTGHLIGNDDENLKDKIIEPLLNWQKMQPEAQINLWYDGDFTSNDAATKTVQILERNGVNSANLHVRDLREIPIRTQEAKFLFAPNIPIYFRVDLAKMIIGDHVLQSDGKKYAVNVDSDMAAIIKYHLFDRRTVELLNGIGLVLAMVQDNFGNAVNENSFIMLSKPAVNIHRQWGIDFLIKHLQNLETIHLEALDPTTTVMRRYAALPTKLKRSYEATHDNRKFETTYGDDGETGKGMIFPSSAHGSKAFTEEMISGLRNALAGPDGCKAHP